MAAMKIIKLLATTLALLVLTSHASAEWVEVEQFDDGIRIYADPASVKHGASADRTARLTHLVRWAEPQVDEGTPAYRSTVVLNDYDCNDKLERYLSSASYAGERGDGAKILADDVAAETWYTISASSMEEKLWKIACGLP